MISLGEMKSPLFFEFFVCLERKNECGKVYSKKNIIFLGLKENFVVLFDMETPQIKKLFFFYSKGSFDLSVACKITQSVQEDLTDL